MFVFPAKFEPEKMTPGNRESHQLAWRYLWNRELDVPDKSVTLVRFPSAVVWLKDLTAVLLDFRLTVSQR